MTTADITKIMQEESPAEWPKVEPVAGSQVEVIVDQDVGVDLPAVFLRRHDYRVQVADKWKRRVLCLAAMSGLNTPDPEYEVPKGKQLESSKTFWDGVRAGIRGKADVVDAQLMPTVQHDPQGGAGNGPQRQEELFITDVYRCDMVYAN